MTEEIITEEIRERGKLLPIFRAPRNYSDYTFWRARHQRYALYVMILAAIYAAFR